MREGVPDGLDPVRRAGRAARARPGAGRGAAGRRLDGARLYGADPDDGVGGFGAFFLLLDEPEVYGLPPDPVSTTRELPEIWLATALAAGRSSPVSRRPSSGGTVSVEVRGYAGGDGGAPEVRTYYGRPVIKAPVWTPEVAGVLLHGRDGGRLRAVWRWAPG